MGGWGSGRRWQSKNTTADYRQLDVRRLQGAGVLDRRCFFSWQWSRDGQPVGNINIRPETDRVILSYRHRTSGRDWRSEEYPVGLERTERRESLVSLSGERLWAARGDSLWWRNLRLPPLSSAGLSLPARVMRRQGRRSRLEDPGEVWRMGQFIRPCFKAKRNALVDIQKARTCVRNRKLRVSEGTCRPDRDEFRGSDGAWVIGG